jgi:DeoR family transcriptional regulator, fructose operon transcriptional repressor
VYAEERHSCIAAISRTRGRVEVTALATELGVTTETIRRDLTSLERRGLLRRVHGGAIPLERLGFEPVLELRSSVLVEEKRRIAAAALAEMPAEGAVLLDSGSTTQLLAEALPLDREITVVTNSLPVATALSGHRWVTLLVTGGRIRGRTKAGVDSWALSALDDVLVDVAFMGTDGISVRRGLTTPDGAEAATKRAMIKAARRVVVLADHTKLGNDALMRFGDLEDIDVLITDSDADQELLAEIENAGPRAVMA